MAQVRAAEVARVDADLTMRSPQMHALLAITFIYPVAFCAVVFPTPASDLREQINLGLTFPLYTWLHPPLQSWIAGLVALTGARDSWAFVFVAQVLNFIGLAYMVQFTKKFIRPEAVVPLVIMYCGSLFYSVVVFSAVLDADQIQVPIWAGVIFYALSAARDNRWRDWLLTAFFVSLGCLSKYYSLIIIATLLTTALWMPAYRSIFVNSRFYVAALLTVAVVSVNLVAEVLNTDVAAYGATRFLLFAPLTNRVTAAWDFFMSYVLYDGPALVGLAVLASRGYVGRPRMPSDPALRFVVLSVVGLLGLILLMIVVGGLTYYARYGYPIYGLWLLAILSVIWIDPRGFRKYANVVLAIWAAIVVGTVIYSHYFIHGILREPVPAAAAFLREAWDRRFSCGPSYVLGTDRAAHGIAIYFDRPVVGIAFDEVDRKGWFDKDRLDRLGAVVVAAPDQVGAEQFSEWFAGKSATTFTLPYRRTLQTDRQAYEYYFIPPHGCRMPVERQ